MKSYYVQRVQRGERITADARNREIDALNQLNRPVLGQIPAAQPLRRPEFVQIAALDDSGRRLECVHRGVVSATPFPVNLPFPFTETSRDFGGTIGTVTYAYTDLNTRTATGSAGSETQYITPPFVIGEIITVWPVEQFWTWQPDGRTWAVDPP